ncbi:DNA topoisomerase (ATP-hydrolyzing) [Rippkaea orientalis PCC 8801]|uniref:DNA topoisomerase (ATP-hydrolyzing) n=1 Tax=Rippkaea orientalis (strain PCC 8801 / RF-1) TaxID=41431 RepID=B7K4F6_RIPO1|nr:DNA topoisomerase (ATP-hydrolyzing) [Rippkaea orientalis]ACK65421.1 DNA topoisomerase (ATP-hydrolyzing) [Rippkaea orientalis PCC 8801]
MTRQLNLLATGQIIPTALHTEMKRSYLEYAMSVIVGRALPDVRDGLKPVHRRILYAMYELGLTPDRPFRKCARVVGDVLGKYHPHGDQAVYDALVRLVQDFSSRYPLLAGHGNFGSVDNDPPAAMRYTETRLASIADTGMLRDISEAIVDFTNNFDNSQQEPVVLPAQLPILLLNGCTGIAVGMATNIPPHNLGEIVDGLVALIDDPELSDEKLWQLIPGPDFPTGGEIITQEGIREAYATGRGIIPVRGITRIETLDVGRKRRRERTAIVVTELPYQVNKAAWIEKMADLVNQGRLEGIADIRDESDRTGMRVVIELKRDAKANTVLKSLYKQTALQSNFGAILLALVDNKPCQLSLRRLLEEFLRFREQTLTRQYTHELEEAQSRLHLLAGLLIALNNLDAIIDILRNAADGTTAKMRFQAELGISDAQANAILAMPMRRLTGLERQKLQSEHSELQTRIEELQTLLSDRHELLKTLKKDLRSLKRKFGDPRRTRIVQPPKTPKSSSTPNVKKEEPPTTLSPKTEESPRKTPSLTLFTPQPPPENAILEINHQGEASWRLPDGQGQDSPIFRAIIGQKSELMVITDAGKAYPVAVAEIPPLTLQAIPLLSLLPKGAQRDANRVIDAGFVPNDPHGYDLLLLTQQGRIKRVKMSELSDLTNRGLVLIKLKEGDRLGFVCPTQEGQEVAIAISGGRILRYPVTDEVIPLMGRSAQGNQALKLRNVGETVVNCLTLHSQGEVLLISSLGYGKRLSLTELRLGKLGDLGTQCLQFTQKTDKLAGMIAAKENGQVRCLTNQNRSLAISVETILPWGKDGPGDRLVKLQPEEVITTVLG